MGEIYRQDILGGVGVVYFNSEFIEGEFWKNRGLGSIEAVRYER